MADENTVSRAEHDRLEARLREAERKNRELEDDNATYRQEKRDLKKKVAKLEDQTDLKDGEVVAKQADLDELASYRELGKLDEVKTQLEEGTAAKKTLADSEAEKAISKAFELAGMKASVGVKLPGAKDLIFETKTEKDEDGEEVEVAMVRRAKNEAPEPLRDYAEKEWEEFLPALLEGDTTRRTERDEDGGLRIPRQSLKRGQRRASDPVEHAKDVIHQDPGHATEYAGF